MAYLMCPTVPMPMVKINTNPGGSTPVSTRPTSGQLWPRTK